MNGRHDYKMYYTMVRAAEEAINILIEAQRKCEQLYLDGVETDVKLLHFGEDHPDGPEH